MHFPRFFLMCRPMVLLAPAALMAQAPAPKPPAAPRPAAPRPAASAASAPTLATDDQKTVYALGLSIYRSLQQFDLSPAEVAIIKQALTDAEAKKPAEDIDTWGPKIEGMARARAAQAAEKQKAASATYLTKAAAEPGVQKTASGVIYKELRPGTGASPKASDSVKVNYRGTLVDGTEFDSSYKRNEPAEFPLGGVIPCWTEGVQMMKVGGKAQLVCPSSAAYGDQGKAPIPGGAALIFEVELLEIAGQAPAPPHN